MGTAAFHTSALCFVANFAQRTDAFDLPLQPQRPTGGQLQFLRQSVAPATRHLSADRTDEK